MTIKTNRSVRLNGLNPLAYLGQNQYTPPGYYILQRDPTNNDWQNFYIGDIWLNQSTPIYNVWMLVSKIGNQAKWILFGSAFGDVQTLTGDTGEPVPPLLGNINVIGGQSVGGQATNINTIGIVNTNTIEVCLNNSISLPNTNAAQTAGAYSLGGILFMHNFGSLNTFLGQLSGNTALTGTANVGIGTLTLNTATSGGHNTVIGYASSSILTTGFNNTASGFETLVSLVSGSYNTAMGYTAGSSYTGAESSNICISNLGVVGESNTIHIGTQGAGVNQQNTCYIAGIAGVTVTNQLPVVINSSTGQLGTTTTIPFYSSGTFIPTLAFGGLSTGITYVSNGGIYTQIGNLVFFNLTIGLSNIGSATGAATISIAGIPTAPTSPNDFSMNAIFITLTAGQTLYWANNIASLTNLSLIQGNISGTGDINITNTNLASNSVITIYGNYWT